MPLPWLSRSAHLETIAAKDETIAFLRETNTALLATISRLSESPADAPKASPRIRKEAPKPISPIDYANLDPNDNAMLVRVAIQEMGPGIRSASLLQRKVEHIRRQVIQSRSESREQRQQPGLMNEQPQETPAEVLARIEAAVQQGRNAAQGVN